MLASERLAANRDKLLLALKTVLILALISLYDGVFDQDWIEFEEIADLEERAKSQFFEKENEEEVQKSQAAAKEKEFQSVRATKDQVGEVRLVPSASAAPLNTNNNKQTCKRCSLCSHVKSVRSPLRPTGWRKRRTGS